MFGLDGCDVSVVEDLIGHERMRQWRDLVLIPSESICLPSTAAVLSSVFTNVYAEGQAEPPLLPRPSETVLDREAFAAWHTRLGDGRYYRGCLNADIAELLAKRFIADAFALLPASPSAADIRVNVQALSGAPANTSVYQALLSPGDAIMGLDLGCGGHLTHGSEYNYSGKTFKVASYGVDPMTRRIDYDRVRSLAREHRPRLLIGGASAYPWDFDWPALRDIADDVGAYLLADVSHLAGLVVGGVLSNPLPYAHVVTFTTHKTLCGPRGAAILTCDPDVARSINNGVFPGLQGGPHVHTIAALARHFETIGSCHEEFAAMQQTVVDNTAYLAECLADRGFVLEYGGTNTHMLLIDLKEFEACGEGCLDGETASRLLELAGLVCNKNMLPGDASGAVASGLRMGMTWATQRGITREQIARVADITRQVLCEAHVFQVWTPSCEERGRGRIASEVLNGARAQTDAIVDALPWPAKPDAPAAPGRASVSVREGTAALLFRGQKSRIGLDQLVTCRAGTLAPGESAEGLVLREDGEVIDRVAVVRLASSEAEDVFAVVTHAGRRDDVALWFEQLSDGYLRFTADMYAKIDGPMAVGHLTDAGEYEAAVREASERLGDVDGRGLAELAREIGGLVVVAKPYFVGQVAACEVVGPAAKSEYVYAPEELPVRKTVLNERHKELGGKMVPFAGWEMPVHYSAGIFEEHRAVRTAAGIFDVSHMSQFEVSGTNATQFLDVVLANCVTRLRPGTAQYTYILYPDGTAIDDLYLYCITKERYIVVANASNAERDMHWLVSAAEGRCAIDTEVAAREAPGGVAIRDLRDAGPDSLAAVAFQGPKAKRILMRLADSDADRLALTAIDRNEFRVVSIAGTRAMVARTGYTGEEVGYEISVHPDSLTAFWDTVLDAGRAEGVLPAGLGARDSTRAEAGLPLFGHELEGDCALSLTDAGYGFVVRFHVPFFVGRRAYLERTRTAAQRVVRLRGSGRRSVRAGHAIVDEGGRAVGSVTSFAYVDADMNFVVLAAVDRGFKPLPGQRVTAVRVARSKYEAPPEANKSVELVAQPRFPTSEERSGWKGVYAK